MPAPLPLLLQAKKVSGKASGKAPAKKKAKKEEFEEFEEEEEEGALGGYSLRLFTHCVAGQAGAVQGWAASSGIGPGSSWEKDVWRRASVTPPGAAVSRALGATAPLLTRTKRCFNPL